MADKDRINILVVDDLPEKLLVIESILEEMGENIIKALSGEEALRKVLEYDFAVILLDVNMPGMDGFETAAFIRKRRRSAHTPIIFITAFADELHTAQGYSMGAVDFILAPVVPEVLRTKVKVFVELFRMTLQVRRQADERVALVQEQAARHAAEEARRRSAFLAEATAVLSRSLDTQTTLRSLARLPVPLLGDLAGVTLVGDHGLPWQSEMAWVRPEGELQTAHVSAAEAPQDELRSAIDQVLASGKPAKLEGIAIPYPVTASSAAPQPGSRLESALVLPLLARGHTLGALTLAMGASRRRYASSDLALAEDLASHAAIALDNARLYQNIQEGDRRKNDFLAMLAHELRNPLAPIRNAVHVLRLLSPADTNLQQARDMIDRQVTHMARLIDDLLDMSRLSRGKILLRSERVNLVDVVRTAVDDYRSLFDSNRIRLQVLLPSEPLPIEGDPTRLAQIVGNILNNAIKFTDPGGEVAVELAAEPGGLNATIRVRDTGIGIDAGMLANMFETFAQADHSLDRSRGGLGLGLSLVRGLVELHGGQVRAASEGLGRGTVITVTLPLLAEPGALTPASAASDQRLVSCRVLVVEDNADAAESLRTLFTLTGHDVNVAHTGHAGLELARSFRPDVVLCDIGLPGGMDGYAVARAFRQDAALAPAYLIALTGYGRDEDKQLSFEAGFNAHFTKPIDFVELQRHLARISTARAGRAEAR